jgi:hypothetical protein
LERCLAEDEIEFLVADINDACLLREIAERDKPSRASPRRILLCLLRCPLRSGVRATPLGARQRMAADSLRQSPSPCAYELSCTSMIPSWRALTGRHASRPPLCSCPPAGPRCAYPRVGHQGSEERKGESLAAIMKDCCCQTAPLSRSKASSGRHLAKLADEALEDDCTIPPAAGEAASRGKPGRSAFLHAMRRSRRQSLRSRGKGGMVTEPSGWRCKLMERIQRRTRT